MKYIIIIAFTALMISGCKSTKNVNGNDTKQIYGEMQKKGFVEGKIVFSDIEGDCAYTIKTTGDTPEYLDPVNLDEKYKIDGSQVWFKFTGLRRQNRCKKARPVQINEIMLRK